MSINKAYRIVGLVAVILFVIGLFVARIGDSAKEVRGAAEATENAMDAAVEASEAVNRFDSINPDSVRAKAEKIGGALGAGIRALVDSAGGGS
jgi:hypothetical protein